MAGGKISRSHTSVIDAAEDILKAAQKLPYVTKISLGAITMKLPPGQHRIKFLPIQGGLRVEVRGTNSKQQFFMYSLDPDETERVLTEAFNQWK